MLLSRYGGYALMKLNLPSARTGALGDQVYARNRRGVSVRFRTVPVDPRTLAQQNNRARFSVVTTGWRNLSAEQRASTGCLAVRSKTSLPVAAEVTRL